jgi:hypothetical protein
MLFIIGQSRVYVVETVYLCFVDWPIIKSINIQSLQQKRETGLL